MDNLQNDTRLIYADVVLPLAFGDTLTYSVPEDMCEAIRPGCRVNVPLGAQRHYTGVVVRVHERQPQGFALKAIETLLDETPILTQQQLNLWQWMADYYMCTLGEVMCAALPSGLKDIDAYRPKTRTFLETVPDFPIDTLSRAKKQLETFLLLQQDSISGPVERKTFLGLHPGTEAHIAALTAREAVRLHHETVSRLVSCTDSLLPLHPLSKPQEKALAEIELVWKEKDICLLHGVTSSGKTEIYIHLMQECIEKGGQVLFLLPEIALTTQITQRLKSFFGDRLGVYHSAYSEAERVEIWNNLLSGDGYRIIVGARSAVFLPFTNLSLVIVDEEHETSYKQQEPAPRYQARNTALVLARMHHAKSLLGTATPSYESYTKACEGKYGLVEISSRYGDVGLPEILYENIRDLKRRKAMKGVFSPLLIEKMKETFDMGCQVMLFQNRRGYAPIVTCRQCGWVPKCKRCDVPLNFHRQSGKLRCHYCGKPYRLPECCPHCGGTLEVQGFGTEKIEEEVSKLFPTVRVARMDTDILHNKSQYESLVEAFANREIDLLVGTQMLAKGLDFGHVRLVGILQADSMMNLPDFRAHERSYQMLTQVSGRCGRKDGQGVVVIQTGDPENPLLQHVKANDYKGLYLEEMQERSLFSYPPYAYLIDIWFRHRDEKTVDSASTLFASWLEKLPQGATAAGPYAPPVARVNNLYLRKITLKILPSVPLKQIKAYLCEARTNLLKSSSFRGVVLFFDVDPL